MKTKNKILIINIIDLILNFIICWFSDQIIDYSFVLSIFFDLFIFISIIFLIVIIIRNFNRELIDYIITIILILNIVLVIFFPFRIVKTKYEFNKYKKARLTIINKIYNNELIAKDRNIVLSDDYKKYSASGEVYLYLKNENNIVVAFWIYRGMMSGSVQLIYSTNEELLLKSNQYIEKVIKLDENWYYVETS